MTRRVNYQERILFGLMDLAEDQTALPRILEVVRPDQFTGNERDLIRILVDRWEQKKDISLPTMAELYPENPVVASIVSRGHSGSYSVDALLEFGEVVKTRNQQEVMASLGRQLVEMSSKSDTKVSDLVSLADKYTLKAQQTVDSESVNFDGIWKKMIDRADRTRGKDMLGPSTSYTLLDKLTRGLQTGSYWIVGGETNIGKSLFIQHLVASAINSQMKCLYITLELSVTDLGYRILGTMLGVELSSLFYNGPEYYFEQIATNQSFQNLSINDRCVTLEDVIYTIKTAKRLNGVQLVVVDYLQNIQVSSKDEYSGLNKATLSLQRLSQLEDICILGVSQIDRASAKSGDGSLHSFKGSGNLENSADIGIVLTAIEDKTVTVDGELVKMAVVKNRIFGFKGDCLLIKQVKKGQLVELSEANATPF